jgi:hypothetical protein
MLNSKSLFTIAMMSLIATVSSATVTYTGPELPNWAQGDQAKIFNTYCIGDANAADIPQPNYKNSLVKQAAEKLSLVSAAHFYNYNVKKVYQINEATSPDYVPSAYTSWANAFLVQVCGEFRDRPSLIKEKIQWAASMNLLPKEKQGPVDPNKNIWSQMTAYSYGPFIELSSQLWDLKRQNLTNSMFKIGQYDVDTPVNGNTVCETKYIFAEYVTKEKTLSDYKEFADGFETYAKENCSKEDREDYYDFRGDSNYKPYTPESNAMIWYSMSIAGNCKSPTEAKDGGKLTNEQCAEYYKNPFSYRWSAARAGLATWLFRDKKHDAQFAAEGTMVAIRPHLTPQEKPFGFSFDLNAVDILSDFDIVWSEISDAWSRADNGFNEWMLLGTKKADTEFSYERLRDGVNRHTDWYNSGYNDGLGGKVREQAYSPFVASSYEMSKSDAFTSCGITVPCPNDGHKRWMFVFRVKKAHWYNTTTLTDNTKVDFDKMWFDETSFGTNGLADSERAWDRMGTALEGELDTVLYLYNMNEYGQVITEAEPAK